jgi:hypothetical protein
MSAAFSGFPTPWENRLLVSTDGTVKPGDYTFQVRAVFEDQKLVVPVTLHVEACVESEPGEFTQAISENPVDLILAGKPAVETGLLVPIQICQPRHLKVTLQTARSEADTEMPEPPPFYLYRSMVWPAPDAIYAQFSGDKWALNAEIPPIGHTDWTLEAEVLPGLYLLIFEQNRYPFRKDQTTIPAAVTYRLDID